MRIVRTLPHSADGRFFAGVPEPIWFDITANEFPDPNQQWPSNRILVNMVPADEVHFDFTSFQGPPTAVAGLKDASNFFDFRLQNISDQNLPAEEKWLGVFDQESFAPDEFPVISEPPPVPFPYLFFGTNQAVSNWSKIAGTFFNTIELARTTNGIRSVLQTKNIPQRLQSMVSSIRLSVVRKPDGSARLIGCLVAFQKFGYLLDNYVGGNHGGAMQSFWLEADALSDDCGPFCGFSI